MIIKYNDRIMYYHRKVSTRYDRRKIQIVHYEQFKALFDSFEYNDKD